MGNGRVEIHEEIFVIIYCLVYEFDGLVGNPLHVVAKCPIAIVVEIFFFFL